MIGPDSPDRWTRVQGVFDAALERAGAERAAFLDRECADDPPLRAEVEALLRAQPEAFEFFDSLRDSLASVAGLEAEAGPRLGGVIHPYRVVDVIGAGGMGTVYLAERADGEFEQHVALKVVRGGLPSPGAIDRFRTERQILARLEHPNIARLLDGGVTGDGLPYLVMELVSGHPLTTDADARRLTLEERLHLFITLGEAVQYLHGHLVVHRDLKPGNVLVTGSGQLKLLDFGIAKLLDPVAGGDLAITGTGARALTPQYAAPEQIRGEPVTTATDVYGLGALLYELLCGRRPFEPVEGQSWADLERAILEREPPPPRAVVRRAASSVVDARAATGAGLARRLRGDLDVICLKALRKEPRARYPSAERLVEDVRRFLQGHPVTARRGTVGYKARKFVRRHRLVVAASAAVIGLGLGFGVVTWVQSAHVLRERDRAEAVARLLVDLFTVADPGEARGESITAREVLDRGAERLRLGLADQPELEAALLTTIGRVYRNLGLYDRARTVLDEALALRRRELPAGDPDLVESLNELGELLRLQGRYDEAEQVLAEAVGTAGSRRATAVHSARSLDLLGMVLLSRGRLAGADSLFREAFQRNSRVGVADGLEAAENLQNLGAVHAARGEFEASEPYFRRALAIRERELGRDHPAVAATLGNLATILARRGAYDEAIGVQREALERYRALLDPQHPQVATMLGNLGMMLQGKGDPAGAEDVLRESLAIRRAGLPPGHPDLAQSLSNLALLLQEQGRYAEAEQAQREALAIREEGLGPTHPQVAQSLNNLGLLLQATGDYDGAEALLRRALEILGPALGERHPLVATNLHNLAALLHAAGALGAADSLYREALAVRRAVLPEGHPHTAFTLQGLGEALLDQRDPAGAEPLLREALEIRRGTLPPDHWQVAETESALGAALLELGRAGEARPLLTRSHESLSRGRGEADALTAKARARLAGLAGRDPSG